MKKDILCIECPKGCELSVSRNDDDVIVVTGNSCDKGNAYGVKELDNPTRVLTTTVKVDSQCARLLSVKTDSGVPVDKLIECTQFLHNVSVSIPVSAGDVVCRDVLGLGVNVIATRSI